MDYLAAVAAKGVDALYVLSGVCTPAPLDSLTADEDRLLGAFRRLPSADQAAVWHLLNRLAGETDGPDAPRVRRLDRQAYFHDALR